MNFLSLSDPVNLVIYLAILLFSVIFHEIAHGLMAEKLGDPTAREAGRLTLNPIPHIDLFGSILLPAFLILIHSPILFGSAKPVPVDYRNLRNIKWDMLLVSLAGPATNFILALLAGMVYHLAPHLSETGGYLLIQTITLNLVLCFFNLIPIPPLDGSKILASLVGFINREGMFVFLSLERYGFIILIFFLYTGWIQNIILPPVAYFARIFIGRSIGF